MFWENREANRKRRSPDRYVETSANTDRQFAFMQINNAKIKAQLDCTLDITIISRDNWEQFSKLTQTLLCSINQRFGLHCQSMV